jgi:hypothetical protein
VPELQLRWKACCFEHKSAALLATCKYPLIDSETLTCRLYEDNEGCGMYFHRGKLNGQAQLTGCSKMSTMCLKEALVPPICYVHYYSAAHCPALSLRKPLYTMLRQGSRKVAEILGQNLLEQALVERVLSNSTASSSTSNPATLGRAFVNAGRNLGQSVRGGVLELPAAGTARQQRVR